MKNIIIGLLLLLSINTFGFDGKEIYIPKDLQGMDLKSDTSKWSYNRMALSENFVIFWEKGFGKDLNNSPTLDGKPMKVNLNALISRLEYFYNYYRNILYFTKGKSKCDKYRMMVMINYSLEGTAYGGDYDGVIGALWVAPNRIQDKTMNCMAHELGHCFQSQIICDGQGEAWGGSGFFEMTSQWMLWQVNPNWITDEKYHWDAFSKLTHKAYLHMTNIYHSPYILEYWSEKRGNKIIAELFRNGKRGEDPAMTYKQIENLSQKEFCDEMYDASAHIVNMDFARVWDETRPYANKYSTKFDAGEDGWMKVTKENAPQDYGFNAIHLSVPRKGDKVAIKFKSQNDKEILQQTGWRYGFVAVTSNGKTIYGKMMSNNDGSVSFTAPENEALKHLWLVVMAAPTEHKSISMEKEPSDYTYYIKIKGSTII